MMDASEDADEMEDNNSSSSHDAPPATRALCGNSLLLSAMTDLSTVCRLSFLCRSCHAGFGSRARKACLLEGAGVPEDKRVEFWSCALNVNKVRRTQYEQAHVFEE